MFRLDPMDGARDMDRRADRDRVRDRDRNMDRGTYWRRINVKHDND